MKINNKTYRTCLSGMLIALALVLGYLESLVWMWVPINPLMPGAKLGLSNLVTIIALYKLDIKNTILITFVRVLLSSMLFGNMTVMLYSMAGAALSLLVMALMVRINVFSKTGVSIAGGVAHNIGQLMVAWLVIGSGNMFYFYYMPVLLVAGAVAGACIGMLASLIIKIINFLFMET